MKLFSRRSAIALLAVSLAATASTGAHADGHAEAKVTIQSFAFQPARLVVAAGTKVTFVNKDGAPHTATAKNKSFDTGKLRKGQAASLTFKTPGTYEYFCAVHPHMTATIVVE